MINRRISTACALTHGKFPSYTTKRKHTNPQTHTISPRTSLTQWIDKRNQYDLMIINEWMGQWIPSPIKHRSINILCAVLHDWYSSLRYCFQSELLFCCAHVSFCHSQLPFTIRVLYFFFSASIFVLQLMVVNVVWHLKLTFYYPLKIAWFYCFCIFFFFSKLVMCQWMRVFTTQQKRQHSTIFQMRSSHCV